MSYMTKHRRNEHNDATEHITLPFLPLVVHLLYSAFGKPLCTQATVYRDCPRTHARTHNELKTAITAYIRNISQADIQKVFANKIKRVQACTDARGHHFQTSNTFHKCTATFRTHCIYLWTKRRPRTYVIFYMSHYSEQDRRRTSPAWGKRFFSSPRRPDGLWSLSSFLFNA